MYPYKLQMLQKKDDLLSRTGVKFLYVSYEAFDGATWENPLFSDWKALYEGKKRQ